MEEIKQKLCNLLGMLPPSKYRTEKTTTAAKLRKATTSKTYRGEYDGSLDLGSFSMLK